MRFFPWVELPLKSLNNCSAWYFLQLFYSSWAFALGKMSNQALVGMKPCVKAHPLRIATTRFITRVARFIRTEFRAFIFLLFFLFLQNHPQFPIVKLYVVSPFHAIFTLFPAIQNKRKSHQNCFNYYFTKLMRVRDRIWISIPIYYYYFYLIWFPHFFLQAFNLLTLWLLIQSWVSCFLLVQILG